MIWETKINFSTFFCNFNISIKILTFSKKKMTLIANIFPKLRTPKNVVNQISLKVPFHRTLWQATCKGDKTLLKSERYHLYHIHWSLWKQQKAFIQFIAAFWKARLNFELFEKGDNPHTWFISNIMDSEKCD